MPKVNRTGNFIAGGNPQVTSLTSNNGVFDIKDEYIATTNKAWQTDSGYYKISKSLRMRGTGFLYRTPTTAGNSKTWTFATWVKIGSYAGNEFEIFSAGDTYIGYANGKFYANLRAASTNYFITPGSNVFHRDYSAWYHVMLVCDTTQAIAYNRASLYINGVKLTNLSDSSFANMSQNYDTYVNTANQHCIGRYSFGGNQLDGYLADTYLIDGQALDPLSFGYFDANTGNYQPKPYTGSYGINGFYLNYTDVTSQTYSSNVGIGRDFSGNGNYYISTGTNIYGNTVVSFTSTGSTTWTAPAGVTQVQYLVVAGGGGGGYGGGGSGAGAGGAGGMLQGLKTVSPGTSYTVTVGGAGGGNGSGGNSVFDTVTCIGGGGGGNASGGSGQSGGSGGGGAAVGGGYGAGTAGQGNRGGYVGGLNQGDNGAAGGGGAGGQGQDNTWSNNGSGGGSGIVSYITGAGVEYARGGNGGVGAYWSASYPRSGKGSNTGWGGDGGNANYYGPTSGASGIVVLSYGTASTSSNYDSSTDTPTNVQSNSDIGGAVSGNYCVMNPLFVSPALIVSSTSGSLNTISNSNLTVTSAGSTVSVGSIGTIGASSGKWYFECVATAVTTTGNAVGFTRLVADEYYWYRSTGAFAGDSTTGTPATWGVGDVIGVAADLDSGVITFYKNSVSQGTATITGSKLGSTFFPVVWYRDNTNTPSSNLNFGQRAFAYAPPAGYKSLNTANLAALGAAQAASPALQSNKWFDVSLTNGNTTGRTVSGLKFQPDLVIIKNRDGSTNRRWSWFDSVRGPNNHLTSQLTDAEVTTQTDLLQSFNSDGFTIGADAALYGANGFNERYAHWSFKQSPTAGFNIVSYASGATGDKNITHNLGVTPKFIITKSRDSGVFNWSIYHASACSNLQWLRFTTDSIVSNGTNCWGTGHTSSTFGITSGNGVVANTNCIAYVWADVPGYSKFGSYVGNGSTDGVFVYTGFKPKLVMIKNVSASPTNWSIIDTARDINNLSGQALMPNSSAAEYTAASSGYPIDMLSNGFKLRWSGEQNASGNTFVYAAWAESPFALNNRAK